MAADPAEVARPASGGLFHLDKLHLYDFFQKLQSCPLILEGLDRALEKRVGETCRMGHPDLDHPCQVRFSARLLAGVLRAGGSLPQMLVDGILAPMAHDGEEIVDDALGVGPYPLVKIVTKALSDFSASSGIDRSFGIRGSNAQTTGRQAIGEAGTGTAKPERAPRSRRSNRRGVAIYCRAISFSTTTRSWPSLTDCSRYW